MPCLQVRTGRHTRIGASSLAEAAAEPALQARPGPHCGTMPTDPEGWLGGEMCFQSADLPSHRTLNSSWWPRVHTKCPPPWASWHTSNLMISVDRETTHSSPRWPWLHGTALCKQPMWEHSGLPMTINISPKITSVEHLGICSMMVFIPPVTELWPSPGYS